jgi:hypothetical protein
MGTRHPCGKKLAMSLGFPIISFMCAGIGQLVGESHRTMCNKGWYRVMGAGLFDL